MIEKSKAPASAPAPASPAPLAPVSSGPASLRPGSDSHPALRLLQQAGNQAASSQIARPQGESRDLSASQQFSELRAREEMDLIVPDEMLQIEPGQMRKSDFLDQLNQAVCQSAEAALASSGRSTDGCPYLERWFAYYQAQDSQHIQRALYKYAPETRLLTHAGSTIPLISGRVARSVSTWVATGKITGVPPELRSSGYFPPVGSASPSPATQAVQEQLGAGRPLESELRAHMESAFNTDFSGVRLHTDEQAARISQSVQARAFTVGEHIAFGRSEYQPGTLTTDAVLAHELAHVVQQRGQMKTVAREVPNSSGEQALEAEADRAAMGALSRMRQGGRRLTGRLRQAIPNLAQQAMPRLRTGLSLQRCGFMVPDVWMIAYEDRITLGSDPFKISIEINSRGHETPPSNTLARDVYVHIDYDGREDADIESIEFKGSTPKLDVEPTPVVTHGQRTVKEDDGTFQQDWVKVDLFSDGSYSVDFTHRSFPNNALVPPIRVHDFCVTTTGKKEDCRTIEVKNWDAKRVQPATPQPDASLPAQPTPGLGAGRLEKLPTSTLLDTLVARLGEIKKTSPGIETLLTQVDKDRLAAPTAGEADLRARAERLNQELVGVQPVFPALESLSKTENYLPDIAWKITGRAAEIRDLYIKALEAVYNNEPEYDRSLADADYAMQAFPDFIVKQYLTDEGITSLVKQLAGLRENLVQLRAKTGRATNSRPADRMIRFGNWNANTPTAELTRDIAKARRERFYKGPKVAEFVQQLTQNAQKQIALTTALVFYEQFIYWVQELDDSVIDWLYDPKLKLAKEYRDKLDVILTGFEKYGSGKTPKENEAILLDGMDKVIKLTNSKEFKEAVDAIQERLKTIAIVNLVGVTALIIAAAALTAGAAGAAVGGALEAGGASALTIGAGEFVAETLAFTITSQVGQTIAFGQPSQNFFVELGWNALMFGVAKAAVAGYARLFKLISDPKAFPIVFKLGQIGTAAIALQAFAEAQHGLTTGKAMTGEERYRSILQNVILTVTLEAGRFITKPLEARIGAAIGAKLKTAFTDQLASLQTERAALTEHLGKLERGTATPKEVADLLTSIQDLWLKEIKLLSDGVQRKAISEAEAQKASAPYKDQIRQLELRLSQIGFESPLSQGAPSFRPLVLGVVAYTAEARAVLEAFYKSRNGMLSESKTVPDMLEGRLPNGELTFYVLEGTTPKNLPTAEKIVAARDLSRQEAAGDPMAAEGLKRLESDQGTGLGARKIDEILASVPPGELNGFLRAMDSPAFNKQLGGDFYTGLAENPAAALFGRTYGGDVLASMYRTYGKRWSPEFLDALNRATTRLENAATQQAKQELLDTLRNVRDLTKIETALGNPPPPKPPPPPAVTKANMGINRSSSAWKTLRVEAERFAKEHGETLTSDQIDLRADLDQVVDAAKRGRFDKLGRNSKISILDRFDQMAAKSGMLQNWINAKRGSLSEALFLPQRGVKKFTFKDGAEVPWGTKGATIPDYALPHSGFTEWVNQKSDLIDSGPKPGGVYSSGRAAASTYRLKADVEAGNLPPGEKYSLDFIRDPGPATRQAMMDRLFEPGSPVYRVKFGDVWYERPGVPSP